MSLNSTSFSNNDFTDNTSTSNPFGTVGSGWMNDLPSLDMDSEMLPLPGEYTDNQKQQKQQSNKAGQRVNSAPTTLSNNNKKANWGALLGKKKTSNKRKFGSTNHKRSMSLNLSILDNDMSGLQVLSPKTKPTNNNNTGDEVIRTFSLDDSISNANESNGNNKNAGLNSMGNSSRAIINTPKHKRSKSDNSIIPIPTFGTYNGFQKVMSNRSAAALGKLRGSYKCGKCGVPKKGHICPHELPKETRDAETQCSFDINPNVESQQIRRLVQKLQEKGIITLSGSSDAFNALVKNVKSTVASHQKEVSAMKAEVQQRAQAATGTTSSPNSSTKKKSKKSTSKNSKKSIVKAKNPTKIRKTKGERVNKNNIEYSNKKNTKKNSPKPKSVKSRKKSTVNSLRTFDSIDSNSSDPFNMDMDPTDAFDYSEFDLANDGLSDDKWFGDEIVDTNYDEEMSAMLSA